MRKPLKIVLIVVLVLAGIYGARILYGLFIFYNVSSEDQLKIAQFSYDKCVAKGKEDCEGFLVMGYKAALSTQKQEAMDLVMDKTSLEQDRIDALLTFYLLSRNESQAMDKQEVDFYYVVTLDDENSLYLSQKAYEYLLEAATDDPKVVQIQIQTLEDPGAELEYKKKAILALGQAGISEAADILVRMLEDGGGDYEMNLAIKEALMNIGSEIIIPNLIDIAVDTIKPNPVRNSAIEIAAALYDQHRVNNPIIIETLKGLLRDNNYIIRLAAADALMFLTNKEYKIEESGADEDIGEFIEEAYGLIID